jgi:hypothetical protein
MLQPQEKQPPQLPWLPRENIPPKLPQLPQLPPENQPPQLPQPPLLPQPPRLPKLPKPASAVTVPNATATKAAKANAK